MVMQKRAVCTKERGISMNEKFDGVVGTKSWGVSDEGFTHGDKFYTFDSLKKVTPSRVPPSAFTNGVAAVESKDSKYMNCGYKKKDKERAEKAIEFLQEKVQSADLKARPDVIYSLNGARGRHMDVYDDRVCIITEITLGSLVSGNVTDGTKEIYYSDVIAVQYKAPTVTLGYIQLETASMTMNNRNSNFFNENTFTYNSGDLPNGLDEEVVKFLKDKVADCKAKKNAPTVVQSSAADELKKFKELLDMGAITQEEFAAKKKQLLGL